jgi:hypothetical protein
VYGFTPQFIVNGSDGRIFSLPWSMFEPNVSTEALAAYAAGFRFERYDLTIVRVQRITCAIQHLLALGMSYIEPKERFHEVWRITRPYDAERLRRRLQQLPARFEGETFRGGLPPIFEAIDECGCFLYELSEHLGSA